MAIIKGKYLRGLIGNVVTREYRGQQVIQLKPETPKNHRTEGTENAAKVFGLASKLANAIRNGLREAYGTFNDGTMTYRLNKEVLHSLNKVKQAETQDFAIRTDSFQGLAGFEFNALSPVRQQLLVQLLTTIEGRQLHITIPELKLPGALKFPNHADSCKLALCAAQIDLSNGYCASLPVQVMDIPYPNQASTLPLQKFTFDLKPGCLCITAVSLQFVEKTFVGEVLTNHKQFNPAAILYTHFSEGEATIGQPVQGQDFHFRINRVPD